MVKAYQQSTSLYFFVAKKNEVLLCAEFLEEVKQKLHIPIFGEINTFRDLFGLLMQVSKSKSFTLIIDEFQEFTSVNPSIYSDMQNIWDNAKSESKINLILCGSVYSMMSRIFENAKEPLFGRATQRLHLKAFTITTLKEIITDYKTDFTNEDLLAFYLFTGGVAKYVELLAQSNAFSFEAILNEILADNSLFLEEGKNVLIDEFGKEYGNYFSILSLIASGKTSRTEIESIMEMQTGGFLDRLENEYGLIKKVRPILAKPSSRSIKYGIEDHFLKFWFRFIYKYRSAVEIGNLEYLKEIIKRDYATYSGKILENYFIEKLMATKQYNTIGTYWERNNQNEIDIVAINDLEKKVLFAEVKRNPDKLNLNNLIEKSQNLVPHFKEYQIEYQGFSIKICNTIMYPNYIKPFFDFISAFIGFILASPIFLVCTIALAIVNKGTPFFTQLRPGKEGKLFAIYKFKTMTDAKDANGNLLPDAQRLTKVGTLVRKTSLDELPQLFNVLRGELSFTGPRPLLPEYLPLYNDFQKRRHEVKPGISGWAQVNGRNAISWDQKFAYDVWYVDNCSFSLDIKIVVLTLKKVFVREGISQEGQATMEAFKGNSYGK